MLNRRRYIHIPVFLIAFCLSSIPAQSQGVNDWENPAVVGINKEPAHSTM
ncbi:MAG: hypothetical protein GY863_05145, partial [bacterium]|nr:hypothetical protein [bacterium]